MEVIKTFISKWGILIILFLNIIVFFNTCGNKGRVEKLEKKITNLQQAIISSDSLDRAISSIDREISILETAREVVYTNNAIIRTITRPDDVMNTYSQKIKELQLKKEKLNAARK